MKTIKKNMIKKKKKNVITQCFALFPSIQFLWFFYMVENIFYYNFYVLLFVYIIQ